MFNNVFLEVVVLALFSQTISLVSLMIYNFFVPPFLWKPPQIHLEVDGILKLYKTELKYIMVMWGDKLIPVGRQYELQKIK